MYLTTDIQTEEQKLVTTCPTELLEQKLLGVRNGRGKVSFYMFLALCKVQCKDRCCFNIAIALKRALFWHQWCNDQCACNHLGQILGSSPSRVKLKTIRQVFADSPLSIQHKGVRTKTGWLRIWIMCQETCLSMNCCFSGQALKIHPSVLIQCKVDIIISWNVTCSFHKISEQLLIQH